MSSESVSQTQLLQSLYALSLPLQPNADYTQVEMNQILTTAYRAALADPVVKPHAPLVQPASPYVPSHQVHATRPVLPLNPSSSAALPYGAYQRPRALERPAPSVILMDSDDADGTCLLAFLVPLDHFLRTLSPHFLYTLSQPTIKLFTGLKTGHISFTL
jgi:hypothetical protein